MPKLVLLNTRIFAGAVDLTGNSNQVELMSELEAKDATAFRPVGDPLAGWREVLGGLFSTTINGGGQWEAGDATKVDDETWAKTNGRTIHPWTVCPVSANVGDLAYFTNALRSSYQLGAPVGEVAPWQSSANGSSPLVRGTVAHPAGTARTTTGNGTGQQLGAVSATQKLYAGLHVYSVAGSTPSITVAVQSSVDNTFASPTTRATFTAATVVGGQFLSVAGPVTDQWWRVTWTISGSSPSFLFVASLGIG